jgi:dihydroorotase
MQALGVLTVGPQAVLGTSLGTLQASAGRIAVGGVADLCIFNPDSGWTVQPEALRSQGKHTPFGGHEMPVRVHATLVGGQFAYQAGTERTAHA